MPGQGRGRIRVEAHVESALLELPVIGQLAALCERRLADGEAPQPQLEGRVFPSSEGRFGPKRGFQPVRAAPGTARHRSRSRKAGCSRPLRGGSGQIEDFNRFDAGITEAGGPRLWFHAVLTVAERELMVARSPSPFTVRDGCPVARISDGIAWRPRRRSSSRARAAKGPATTDR